MRVFFISLLAALFFSCNDPVGFRKPEDGLDAGREFVRAVLDGDYKKGELYVIPDDDDIRLYKRYTDYMRKQPGSELIELKQASIIINKVEEVSDSIQIINYSNSYTQKPMDIKVVRKDGEWWVDFSYTFSGNLPITE
jgi:hypothetical protein